MPYCPTCRQEFVAEVDTCPDCGVALQATLPPSPEEPDEHLVDVLVTNDPAEAEVVVGLLQVNDIPCNQHSGVPQNVLPLHVDEMEAIRISVREHDAERARALIASGEREAERD